MVYKTDTRSTTRSQRHPETESRGIAVGVKPHARSTSGLLAGPLENGSAADWAAWTEQHMIKHMAAHQNGSMMHDGMMGGSMSGKGCH